MADNFENHHVGISGPADLHQAITPSDSVDVSPKPRALWVQTDGNLSIADRAGTVLTYAVKAGMVIPFRATKVRATGTTATVYGWE